MTTYWGSARTSGERVSICRACGGGFIPPAHGNCCSVRCCRYLEVAREPVLGDPLFGPQQSMLCRGGCGRRFDSRGINLCPACWERSRSDGSELPRSEEATAGCHATRHDEPSIDRAPARSLCHW
jgi:hypothetical protein